MIAPDTLAVTNAVSGFVAPATADNSLAAAGIAIADDGGVASSILEGSSVFWITLSFLGFGLLLAFTPCVFPIYPIVIGMLGRQGERTNARRGFALSTTYVVGLALAFAIVGAVVGWSGQNIQFALQSPVTTAAVAVLFLVLASSMFGAFELQLPSALTSRFARRSGGGSLGSAGALGFTSALIVGPCVTAPLAGALVYIAQGGDWRLGALALFALGVGKGLPLIAMATFGASLLPRAGRWMEEIKRLFGFGFIAMAIWVATPLMPLAMDLSLYALLLSGRRGRSRTAYLVASGQGGRHGPDPRCGRTGSRRARWQRQAHAGPGEDRASLHAAGPIGPRLHHDGVPRRPSARLRCGRREGRSR